NSEPGAATRHADLTTSSVLDRGPIVIGVQRNSARQTGHLTASRTTSAVQRRAARRLPTSTSTAAEMGVRRDITADPAVRDRFLDGVRRLKGEQLGITAADLGISTDTTPISTYDLFVVWHHLAMNVFTPPDQQDRNAAHRGPVFLPWHRFMLIVFELQLQRVLDEATFGLPYWDWGERRVRPAHHDEIDLRLEPLLASLPGIGTVRTARRLGSVGAVQPPPTGRSQRDNTVYTFPDCDQRALAEQMVRRPQPADTPRRGPCTLPPLR
ncbi:MAG: tyrosinase family protein, partial [Frankiaceae bacterium]